MTEADGGAAPGVRPGRRWDVVLSFAGAQRDYGGAGRRGAEGTGTLVRADRLAGSAESRLLYRYAIPLYRHADAGDGYAARRLAGLLADRGDATWTGCAPGPRRAWR